MNNREKEFLSQYTIEVDADNGDVCINLTSGKYVSVDINTHTFCCGVLEVGGLDIFYDTDEERDNLLKALSIVLQNLNSYDDTRCSLIITSDNSTGFLWRMCTENKGWLQGNVVTNHKSGNLISMFETKVNPL